MYTCKHIIKHFLWSMNDSETSSSYVSFEDASSITPTSLDIVRNGVSGDRSHVPSLIQASESSRHWRDVFWLVLFAFHFLFVGLILGVLGLNRFRKKDRLNIERFTISHREDEPRLTEDYWPFYAVAGAIGTIVGCTWLLLFGSRANDIMKFGVHILTTYLAVISVLCFWDDHFFWAVAFAIGAVLQFLYVISVIDRLPYTMLILQRAVNMVWTVPEVMRVSCAFMLVMLLWLALWSFGAAGIVAWNIGEGGRWFLLAVLSVSLFWTGAVLCNVVHVIVSGMVFLVLVHGGRGATTMPPKALRKYLWYAITTSLGSICYGSLFTGSIRTLRWQVGLPITNLSPLFGFHGEQIRGVRSKIRDNECLLYCVDFLFHLVETLVRFYNKYAYVQIAVCGTSFNHSARDAWELFQCTGTEALIAYDCSGAVLLMGTLLGGLLSGTSAGIWAKMKYPEEVMMVASTTMLMGMMLVGLATVVVESAVTSIYICYSKDPLLIQRWDEDFFNQMSELFHQRLQHRSARSREV